MNDETQYDELDLMDILLTLKKYWKMIITLTIVTILIIGCITMFFIQPKYESQVLFELVNLTELRNSEVKNKITNPQYHLELIRSREFLEETFNGDGVDLDSGSINSLAKSIQMQKTTNNVFTLKVVWPDPEVACKLAQNIFESHQVNIINLLREQDNTKRHILLEQLAKKQAELEEAENQIALYEKENGIFVLANQIIMKDRYNERQGNDLSEVLKNHRLLQHRRDVVNEAYLNISKLINNLDIDQASVESILIRVIDPPVVPEGKVSPSLELNLAVAGFLGLFIGVMLAFFLEYIKNYKTNNSSVSQ